MSTKPEVRKVFCDRCGYAPCLCQDKALRYSNEEWFRMRERLQRERDKFKDALVAAHERLSKYGEKGPKQVGRAMAQIEKVLPRLAPKVEETPEKKIDREGAIRWTLAGLIAPDLLEYVKELQDQLTDVNIEKRWQENYRKIIGEMKHEQL